MIDGGSGLNGRRSTGGGHWWRYEYIYSNRVPNTCKLVCIYKRELVESLIVSSSKRSKRRALSAVLDLYLKWSSVTFNHIPFDEMFGEKDPLQIPSCARGERQLTITGS